MHTQTKGQSDLKTLVQKMCAEFAVNCPVITREANQQHLQPVAYSPPPRPTMPYYYPDPQAHYHSSFPTYNVHDQQIARLQEELTTEKLRRTQLQQQNAKLHESVTKRGKLTRQLTEEQDEKIHQLQSELQDVKSRLEDSDKVQAELMRESDTVAQLQTQLQRAESDNKQLAAQRDATIHQQQQLQTQLQHVESEKKQIEVQRDDAVHQQHLLQAQLQQNVCEQQQNAYNTKAEDEKSRFTQLLVPSQLDDDSWNVHRDEVKIFDKIGRGAWGIVSRGEFRNQTVAVKQAYQEHHFEESTIRQMRREIQVMAHVQHPNIVRFIAAVIDDKVYSGQDTPLLVIELLDMNLRDAYIRTTDLDVVSIFQDVAYALHYLHEHQEPIFHRDVSAPNVLLKSLPGDAFQAKLSDLGSANKVKHAKTATTGAMCYIAPESLPPKNPHAPMPKPTTKIDVFSYGILLTEVITKTLPTVENRILLFLEVQKQWKVMYDLICQCIQENPADRPTMSNILSKLQRISTS